MERLTSRRNPVAPHNVSSVEHISEIVNTRLKGNFLTLIQGRGNHDWTPRQYRSIWLEAAYRLAEATLFALTHAVSSHECALFPSSEHVLYTKESRGDPPALDESPCVETHLIYTTRRFGYSIIAKYEHMFSIVDTNTCSTYRKAA